MSRQTWLLLHYPIFSPPKLDPVKRKGRPQLPKAKYQKNKTEKNCSPAEGDMVSSKNARIKCKKCTQS